jgi:hypothetical protein
MFLSVQNCNELKEREPEITDNLHSLRSTLFSFYRLGCLKNVCCEIAGYISGFVGNSSLLRNDAPSFAQSSRCFEVSYCHHLQGTKYKNNCSCTVCHRKWRQQNFKMLGNSERTELRHITEELNLKSKAFADVSSLLCTCSDLRHTHVVCGTETTKIPTQVLKVTNISS